MSKVKVTANSEGNVIIPSENNPEYGYVRVQQERPMFNDRGFMTNVKLSALIPGKITDLKTLGWVDGQELPGKIVVKEQLAPFNKKDPTRDLKKAGETGITIMQNGQPIYRNTFYKPDPNAVDVLEEHTNREEIKAAYAELEKTPAGKKAGAEKSFGLE